MSKNQHMGLTMKIGNIIFPRFTAARCLMMPYIQGCPDSVPDAYRTYRDVLSQLFLVRGDIGFLTIDESVVKSGTAHRAGRAKFSRALHTEAGRHPDRKYSWGGGGWGSSHRTLLDGDVEILIANNIDDSCAVWNAWHQNTSMDGDIGDRSEQYPYDNAIMMKAGEVFRIGILTPHESLPVRADANRQFLRIVSSGVHGREPYFTDNPMVRL